MYMLKVYEGIMVVYSGIYTQDSIIIGVPTWKVEAFA